MAVKRKEARHAKCSRERATCSADVAEGNLYSAERASVHSPYIF